MEVNKIGADFCNFMNVCTDPISFTRYADAVLTQKGFTKISESKLPETAPKQGFFIRSHRTLIAYDIGGYNSAVIAAAHSDSPCIKLKKQFDGSTTLYQYLNLSNYTGGLAHTMFGRDLILKGNIYYKENEQMKTKFVNTVRPIGFIPFPEVTIQPDFALKPNFDRDRNMKIIVGTNSSTPVRTYLENLAKIPQNSIISVDLYLVDAKPATMVNDLVTSARLDNLLSSYCCFNGFLSSTPENTINICAIYDNEENGSHTLNGALGDMLERVLRFLSSRNPNNPELSIEQKHDVLKRNSIIISADAAHGRHPNYVGIYETNHPPTMGHGVVLKGPNANSTGFNLRGQLLIQQSGLTGSAKVMKIAKTNSPSTGGTIGPKMEMLNGISTIDMGAPTLGMHSYRETAATKDVRDHLKLIETVYKKYDILLRAIDGDEITLEEYDRSIAPAAPAKKKAKGKKKKEAEETKKEEAKE